MDRRGTPLALALVEACREPLYALTPEGVILAWNWGCEVVFGHSRDEAVGASFLDLLVPEEGRAEARAQLREALETGSSIYEAVRRRKAGGEVVVEVTLRAMLEGPEAPFLVACARDVTDHKRLEEQVLSHNRELDRARREAETTARNMRLILESASEGICGVDGSGVITFANASASRLLGADPTSLEGRSLHDVAHPLGADGALPSRGSCAACLAQLEGRGQRLESAMLRRLDGAPVPVSFAAAPVLEASGTRGGVVVFADMTERTRAESELRLAHGLTLEMARAESVHDALGVALRSVCTMTGWVLGQAWVTEPGGMRLACSPAWHASRPGFEGFREASLGRTFDRGVGLPGRVLASGAPAWVRDVRDDANFPRAPWAREAHLAAGMGFPVIARGQVVAVLEFFVVERREEDERLLQVVSNVAAQLGEVLQRRLAEDALRQSEARLLGLSGELQLRLRELEVVNHELESFSFSVSHDLRAPLRALDGFSRALLEDLGPSLDGASRDYLDRIRGASQRMAIQIEDLLRLSRLSRAPLSRSTLDLGALAEEVLEELRIGEPGRRVEAVVRPGMLVEADPVLLRAAVANLLGNAWKFTGRRATARIEVGLLPGGAPVFFVRDNGAGFDMAYASKLFTPFQRLHTGADFAGHGIGLATVQRIIHRHGGRVWAEAEVERGATFFFTLTPGVDATRALAAPPPLQKEVAG